MACHLSSGKSSSSPRCHFPIAVLVYSFGKKVAVGAKKYVANREVKFSTNEAEIMKFSKDLDVKIKKITTKGDIIQDVRLSDTGGKGLFCNLIEEDLTNKKIILTGGSRGIGLSILKEIYKLNAKILIIGTNQDLSLIHI